MKRALTNPVAALLIALALFCAGGCNNDSPEQRAKVQQTATEETVTPDPIPPQQAEVQQAATEETPAPETETSARGVPVPEVQEADAAFGFQMLGQLAAAKGSEDNLLIGPRNIRTALAAVAVGAAGQTRDEILAQTGDYDSIDNAAGKSFTNALHIRVPLGKKLQAKFSEHFPDARVESTTPAKALDAINAYVDEQTKGKFRGILNGPPSEDGIVLTTVLDFEGKWLSPFKPEDTNVEKFFITPDKHQKTHLMSASGDFRYSATQDGQMVQLPYQDDDLVMTIFLPKPELSLADWLKKQGKGKDWLTAVRAMEYGREGYVELPRVKFDFPAELEATLQAMGIQRAFTDAAEFNGILQNSDPLKIVFVIHKTGIDVDEQGTRAFAMFSIEMGLGAPAGPRDPFSMRIDRPFFLTIGDRDNHKILFMGIVRQPSKAGFFSW